MPSLGAEFKDLRRKAASLLAFDRERKASCSDTDQKVIPCGHEEEFETLRLKSEPRQSTWLFVQCHYIPHFA